MRNTDEDLRYQNIVRARTQMPPATLPPRPAREMAILVWIALPQAGVLLFYEWYPFNRVANLFASPNTPKFKSSRKRMIELLSTKSKLHF